jgi:hypothetical protein
MPQPAHPSQFSLRAVFYVTAAAALFTALLAALDHHVERQKVEELRISKENQAIRESIVLEVEAVRARLGRAPADQSELEVILGRPLPSVSEYGHELSIRYHTEGANDFILEHLSFGNGDYLNYHSNAANAGWTPFYD